MSFSCLYTQKKGQAKKEERKSQHAQREKYVQKREKNERKKRKKINVFDKRYRQDGFDVNRIGEIRKATPNFSYVHCLSIKHTHTYMISTHSWVSLVVLLVVEYVWAWENRFVDRFLFHVPKHYAPQFQKLFPH